VLILGAGVLSGGVLPLPEMGAKPLATAGFIAGAILLIGALIALTVVRAKREERRAVTEASELKRSLAAVDSIIRSEPQILLFWEQNQPLHVAAFSLHAIPGLPDSPDKFLRFGQWLEPTSAGTLKPAIDALFTNGQPFSLIVRTISGGHVEAEGRTAGGRAVLRFRDVAGHREEVARILAQHQRLGREVRASRALLDALPVPVWLRSKDGRITWVNNAYARAVEAPSRADVLERQIELLEQRQRRAAARVLARGESYRGRIPLIVGSERRTHDVMMLPFEDATAAAAIDVMALEKTSGEPVALPYDRTLDRVATAVAIFNAQQQLVFFNEAYRKLWQLDEDWLKTRPTEGAVLDRLRELGRLPQVVNYGEWKAKFLSAYGETSAEDDTWLLPDGRTLQVLIEKRSDGGLTYLFVDETERLALEREYNVHIGVQRETLDSLKEGVAVFGTNGRLELFNTACEEIWNLSRRQLAEEPHVDEFIALAQPLYDDAQTWARLNRSVTSFSEQRDEFGGQMVRTDGRIVEYAAMPLPDGGTLFTFSDVTDAKHYQRALEERNDALVAADRIKNAFISHVSYKLRTPLTSIIGFSEMLSNPILGELNRKQQEYLGDISNSSKELLAIIDDILTLATIDAGTMELKLSHVDTPAVIDAAILGVREAAQRARLSLHIAVADDATHLVADEARVRQILFNLLSNAVGFSKPGSKVSITCRRDGDMIVFTVEDEGVGIPKGEQDKAFDRFESRSLGSGHRGAGLGLSIVKSLVGLHGGTVALESEPGHGTRVTVRLPAEGQPAKAALPALPQEGPEGPLSAKGSHA
jgi:signal transduction histidine kinase